MKRVLALMMADWRSISRDLLLGITIIVPLFVAVFVRVTVPIATNLLATSFDLTEHYTFIASIVILMTPMMLGAMAGLQILDDRDERVLTSISVTPLTREGYLIWKLLTPMVMGCVLTPAMILIMDIVPIRLGVVIPVTLLASLGAPLYALLLATFAGNKVEGLAISKASGVLMWAPFAGYLLGSFWHIPAGLMPPYWPSMAFVAGYEKNSSFWVLILAGIFVHLAWIALLRQRFNKRAG